MLIAHANITRSCALRYTGCMETGRLGINRHDFRIETDDTFHCYTKRAGHLQVITHRLREVFKSSTVLGPQQAVRQSTCWRLQAASTQLGEVKEMLVVSNRDSKNVLLLHCTSYPEQVNFQDFVELRIPVRGGVDRVFRALDDLPEFNT